MSNTSGSSIDVERAFAGLNRLYLATRQRGEDRYNSKLTEADVREIRRLGPTTKNIALAAQFGVSESNIEFILSRKTWKHVE